MPTRRNAKQEPRAGWGWRLIQGLPILLPVGVAAFGAVAVGLLLLNSFTTGVVWGIGLLAALAAMTVVFRYSDTERPGSRTEQRWLDLLVLVGVVGWALFNVSYTFQHVLTDRDPATYAVTSVWLTYHDNLVIDKPDVFGDDPNVSAASAGFHVIPGDDQVYAQGAHLLPALLGAAGRLVGDSVLLHLNVLLGGLALLAIYAFARLFMRPRWAALGVGVMAVSLPLIYFSRDTYTEPLMAALVFGSLALLWVAQQKDRLVLWLLAGFVAGTATLTRIDAYLYLIALAAFAVILLATRKRPQRMRTLAQVAVMVVGAGIASMLGWLDLVVLSQVYYRGHAELIHQELIVLAAVALIGVGAVLLAWYTKLLKHLDSLTKKWRAPAVFALFILVAAVLASRPLWHVAYTTQQNGVTAMLQMAVGMEVEPRSYAEQTVNWVVWYIGLPITVLGGLGVALAATRIVAGRGMLLMAGFLTIVGTALVYLIKPSITPDQIWASRRLLPVILPGLIVLGVYALDRGFAKLRGHVAVRYLIGLPIAVVVIAVPLTVSMPFLRHRELTQLEPIKSVCDMVPDSAAVLWIGMARLEAVQPTRAFCGVPAMGYREDVYDHAAIARIAENAQAHGYVPLIGVYGSQSGIIPESYRANMESIGFSYDKMERTLLRPPSALNAVGDSFMLGEILPTGTVRGINN